MEEQFDEQSLEVHSEESKAYGKFFSASFNAYVKYLKDKNSEELNESFTKLKKINNLYFLISMRILDSLFHVGYFGKKDEPFNYDSGRAFNFRNSFTVPDNGLLLFLYIISELQNEENRRFLQEETKKVIKHFLNN